MSSSGLRKTKNEVKIIGKVKQGKHHQCYTKEDNSNMSDCSLNHKFTYKEKCKKLHIKLIDRSTAVKTKSVNIIHYSLLKQDYCVRRNNNNAPGKWCEITGAEEVQRKPELQNYCDKNRSIVVTYKSPQLKKQMRKYFKMLTRKMKLVKKLVYTYDILRISPNQIEIMSEVSLNAVGPYLYILENPRLSVWEELCGAIQHDTGCLVGNIIADVLLINNN